MKNNTIAIIGLGYVGLPLAVEFGKKYKTIGFDINSSRVDQLNSFNDVTNEVDESELRCVLKDTSTSNSSGLFLTTSHEKIKDANFYVVTVPTPTDDKKRPVLTPLIKASQTVGKYLNKEDIVIYESTVYPGVTEDICVPILEEFSNLKFNIDFFVGYSPERINPGDKERTVTKILKVTSGSNKSSALKIDNLYKSIITAGTHLAPSIKVAEAAKVIENSQRDINIAFVNELAKIFNLLDIDTHSVLEAAETKWNFLPFKPGLVGGHCIGVDPYYLAQKAIEVGYNPEIILSGRRLNDSMGSYVANEVLKKILGNNTDHHSHKILLLGFTFKENCPDIRNTRVIDIYKTFIEFGVKVDVYDPWADINEVKEEYKLKLVSKLDYSLNYSAAILCVSHSDFLKIDYNTFKLNKTIIYDVKGFLPSNIVDFRL